MCICPMSIFFIFTGMVKLIGLRIYAQVNIKGDVTYLIAAYIQKPYKAI